MYSRADTWDMSVVTTKLKRGSGVGVGVIEAVGLGVTLGAGEYVADG